MEKPIPLALLPGLLLDDGQWRAQIEGLAGIADCRAADLSTQESVAAMAWKSEMTAAASGLKVVRSQ